MIEETTYDTIIIGAGIGGLCAGALLAKYGERVLLLEAHDVVGGCAHSWRHKKGYTLDAGPSLWSGVSVPSTNPLRQVMDAVGASDSVEWRRYDGWGVHDARTGDKFRMTVGQDAFDAVAAKYGDEEEWRTFLTEADPVTAAANACPPMALRRDPLGFFLFAFLPYLLPGVLRESLRLKAFAPDFLTGPASKLFRNTHRDQQHDAPPSFVRQWIDYLSFAISARPANGTVGAAVAYSLGELYRRDAFLEYPVGGSGAVCEALADAIARRGGRVKLRKMVSRIVTKDGRATGVEVKDANNGKKETVFFEATKAVISNADIWSTTRLVDDDDDGAGPAVAAWRDKVTKDVEPTPSFVHLWVGFDAHGLPADLDCHHTVFNAGFLDDKTEQVPLPPVDARRNMHIISIPSLFDPGLAPPGRHVAHVYAAANEPFWDDDDDDDDSDDDSSGVEDAARKTRDEKRRSYEARKAAAAEPLWAALEQVVPDVRSRRADLVLAGSPRTHARFNRRHRGTYGPSDNFADGTTPIPNLFLVGDSNFPGIGVPAAAASAVLVANGLVDFAKHAALLADMRRAGTLQAGRRWCRDAPTRWPRKAPGGRVAADAPLDVVGSGPGRLTK